MKNFWKTSIDAAVKNLTIIDRLLKSGDLDKNKEREIRSHLKSTLSTLEWMCPESPMTLRQTLRTNHLEHLLAQADK